MKSDSVPVLRWWWLLGLWLLPVAVYSDTLFADFGLRDDYSLLRETHEEPGKVLGFTASHGRPVYGWLLEQSFSRIDRIAGLQWGRLAAALSVGGVAVLMAWVMVRRLGWSRWAGFATAAGVVALPGAQVFVSWSICWPHALAACIGAGGFVLAETGLGEVRRGARVGWLFLAVLTLVVSALIYPPSTLVYVALIAAGWTGWRAWPTAAAVRRSLLHFCMLGGSLALAYVALKGMFAAGWFEASDRFSVDLQWWSKIQWMVVQPLVDGLAVYALRDFWGRAFGFYAMAVFTVVTLLVLGAWAEARRVGWAGAARWCIWVVVCVAASLVVTFLAAERWAPYRTLLALSSVALICVVQAVQGVASQGLGRRRWWAWAGTAIVIGALGLGRWQARALIAEPQMTELAVLREGAATLKPGAVQRVFILRPTLWDSATSMMCFDEFGSLSTNSEWTPGEMLKAILRERPGVGWGVPWRTEVGSHWWLRKGAKPWDAVIDLRAIRHGFHARH